MAYVLNNIPVMTRDAAFAKRLTCMLEKNIKCPKSMRNRDSIEQKLENAAKVKHSLDNANKLRNDIIKESEAAKAYNGIK